MMTKPYSVTFAARAPRREPFDPAVEAAMDAAIYAARLNLAETARTDDGTRSGQILAWTSSLAAQFGPIEAQERAA